MTIRRRWVGGRREEEPSSGIGAMLLGALAGAAMSAFAWWLGLAIGDLMLTR